MEDLKSPDSIHTVQEAEFPFSPGPEQLRIFRRMLEFCKADHPAQVFVLTGQAGTGKTSLIPTLIRRLQKDKVPVELCAPTGRAAQIISGKCSLPGTTIHSMIYQPELNRESMSISLKLKTQNAETARIFIVDESSMIGTLPPQQGLFSSENDLLSDLIAFVKSGNPGNKLILLGDPYQLPPVGQEFSNALSPDFLSEQHQLITVSEELKQIYRQAEKSPILDYATSLREAIQQTGTPGRPPFLIHGNSYAFYRHYTDSLRSMGPEAVTIIASANRSVNIGNREVRKMFWGKNYQDDPLPGELVLVNRNWFNHLFPVANGTLGTIRKLRLSKMKQRAGLHFIPAEVEFKMGSRSQVLDVLLLRESFHSEKGEIGQDAEARLLKTALQYNKKFKESGNMMDDPYLSAMRLRFGYALTCHKAQGGEWKRVFLNPYYREDNLRWLYTAVTRASTEIHSHQIRPATDGELPENTWKTNKVIY